MNYYLAGRKVEVGERVQCPCGGTDDQLMQFYNEGETDFRICQCCGCVFREFFPDADELNEIYKQAYLEENIQGHNTNQESGDFAYGSYANYMLEELIKENDKVLDYGAGSGAMVSILREQGVDADGMEFSETARDFCMAHRGFAMKETLRDVPDGYYQVISMIEVIEHLTDLERGLKEISRVLAPGGRFLITTPSRSGLRARLEKGNWREARKKFHLFLFDWKSIRFHLERVGFINVRRKVFSPLQKTGWKQVVYARCTQAVGLSGTLCVLARKQ